MDTSTVIQSISILFSEAYRGPVDPASPWFIENEPNSGILGIIAGITSKEASWSSKPNVPGTTIAEDVEHLRWSLAGANCALRGKSYRGNCKESWNTIVFQLMGIDEHSKIPCQYLEPTQIKIYGASSNHTIDKMRKVAGSNIEVRVNPQFIDGFIRSRY
jgi:hypothetical protein